LTITNEISANYLFGRKFSAYLHNSTPKAPAITTINQDSHREGQVVKSEVVYWGGPLQN